ncbi:unnamed protein product [Aphanomyces euteiches]
MIRMMSSHSITMDEDLSAPPTPPSSLSTSRPSVLRCLPFLICSATLAVVAAPLTILSSFLAAISRKRFASWHVLLLECLWAMKWRLLRFVKAPQTKPTACALYSNPSYGTVFFGAWNLLDVVFVLVPLSLVVASILIVFNVAFGTLSTATIAIESTVAVVALVGGALSARSIVCNGALPFFTAFALPETPFARGNYAMPQTPTDGDGFHTAYHLDAKLSTLLTPRRSFLSDLFQRYTNSVESTAKRVQRWSDPTPMLPILDTPMSSASESDGSPLPLSSDEDDSSASSPREFVRPSSSSLAQLNVQTCAALIKRNFQRRIHRPAPSRRQSLRRHHSAIVSFAPSAPPAADVLSAPIPLRQLAPINTRQQIGRRPASVTSSSDEEDFQTLCDTVLKRATPRAPHQPLLSPSYDRLSPRSSGLSSSKASSRPVSRSLAGAALDDEALPPCFTAFAPKRVAPNTSFHLVVGCHLAHELDEVKELLAEVGQRPAARTLSLDQVLPRGTRVTISIDVPPGFQVLSPSLHQTMTWRADVDTIAFHLFAQGSLLRSNAPHSILVKVVAQSFVGVLHCCVVVGPSGVSKAQQCEDAWFDMEPVSDPLEVLEPGYEEINYDELRLIKWIGQGHFGDAYLAEYKQKQVVVKTLRKHDIPALQHEAAVLSMFGHHPCVVPFVGACTDAGSPLAVVTEYMPLGSLSSLVTAPDAAARFPSSIRSNMLRDAADGLAHLHSSEFLHRDVAARNCFVDAHEQVKVGDFGLARRGYVVESAAPVVGPLKWMAPETLQPPYVFSQASDVFAFGVTMWEVYHGQAPYADLDPMQVAVRVCEGDRLPLNGTEIPRPHVDLIARCFDPQPEKRPSMVEIYNHLSN